MNLTEEEKDMMRADQKFCRSKEAYCLGKTFAEAAEVIRILMNLKQQEEEEDD